MRAVSSGTGSTGRGCRHMIPPEGGFADFPPVCADPDEFASSIKAAPEPTTSATSRATPPSIPRCFPFRTKRLDRLRLRLLGLHITGITSLARLSKRMGHGSSHEPAQTGSTAPDARGWTARRANYPIPSAHLYIQRTPFPVRASSSLHGCGPADLLFGGAARSIGVNRAV